MSRQDGLRPGEVARAKRVARSVVNALTTVHGPRPRAIAVRNVVARLKANKMRPKDFDTPNGEDAITMIISVMRPRELNVTVPSMGKIWELIASRAVQYLGPGAYR